MLILLQTFPLIATSTLQEVKYQMEKLSLKGLRDLPKITGLLNKPTPPPLNSPARDYLLSALKAGISAHWAHVPGAVLNQFAYFTQKSN